MKKKIISIVILFAILSGLHVIAADTLNANVLFTLSNPGHIYFTGEIVQVPVKYFNNSAADMDLNVDFRAQGRKYQKVWDYKKEVSLPAYKSQDDSVTIDFAGDIGIYDIYDLVITISDGTLTKTITDEFSYVKKGVRNDKFGINTHFLRIDYNQYVDKAIPLAKKAGVGLMRDGFNWASYETTKGSYQISNEYNNIIDAMSANNIDMLSVLAFGNTLYTSTNGHIPASSEEITAYCNYAKNFVKDTKGRVKYFEIWNEPNTSGSFNAGNDDGTNYGNLVKAVYPVIKAENQDAYVLGYSASGLNSYTDKSAATGASSYMDAASFHPYPEYDSTGTYAWATGTQLPETINGYIQRFVNKTGKNNMWITEQGWSDGDNKNSEALCAAYLVRAYTLAMAGGHVEKYFWYELIRSAQYGDTHEGKFGMLQGRTYSTPLAARPIFLAMSNMNSKLADYEVTNLSNTGTLYKCDFENDVDETVSVIWSQSGETANINLGSETIKKTDIYGNEELLFSDSGVYTINAQADPCYYEPVNLEPFAYSYNTESGICTVNGYIESEEADVPVSIALYRPGKENYEIEEDAVMDTLSYFDVSETSGGGVFKYRFSPIYGEGIYLIKLSTPDGTFVEQYLDLRSVLTCSISLDGELASIAAGDSFTCNVTVSGTNDISKTYDVYLALYSNGNLKGVYKKSGERAEDVKTKVTSFDICENYKIDKIRAFAWENGMIPISENGEIQ